MDTETTGRGFSDRAVGLAWSVPDGRRGYLAWGHASENNTSLPEVRRWAQEQLTRTGCEYGWFNAPFDMRMLAYDDVPQPRDPADAQILASLADERQTLSLDAVATSLGLSGKDSSALDDWCARTFGGAATRKAQARNYWRAPGRLVAEYASFDAEQARLIGERLAPEVDALGLGTCYRLERDLLWTLLMMHLHGVRVDIDKARVLRERFADEERERQAALAAAHGPINVNSTPQLAVLFDRLGIPYERTAKGSPSITKELLAQLEHPVAAEVTLIRHLGKFGGTFLDGYILDRHADGIVHGEFVATRSEHGGARTGRFSAVQPNLQNIPKRDEALAPLIRGLYVPWTPEHDWWQRDYSQIEYRFFAHYAGGALRDAYLRDPFVDFHGMMSAMTGIPRPHAKNINFATIYGAGVAKIALMMGATEDEARAVLDEYHRKVPDVRRLQRRAERRAASRGYVRAWGVDRRVRFPRYGRRFGQTHKAMNYLLQGSAANLIKMAMREVARIVDWESTFLHLTVHDELDGSCPRGAVGERFRRDVSEAMTVPFRDRLSVPIVVDGGVGPSWGELADDDQNPQYARAA